MRKRRLLSIGHSYAVALNRRLADEMARLDRGWEVTAVAPRVMRGDLRTIRLESVPDEACRLRPMSAYVTKPVHLMFYGPRLRSVLREGWDLVHCWEEPYVVAGGQVARWTPAGTPLVFWTAQNISKRYPPPFSWIERYCVNRSAGWLACGETTREALLPRGGYGARPHRVMPLGVDTRAFRPDRPARIAMRRELGWSDAGPPVIGFSGRFVEEKGVAFLTQVLDRLATPWRAVFLGNGPLLRSLERWGASFDDDRVRIVPGVSHDRVPAVLSAMDVLCAPSRTLPRWREQLGRMLLEGFACGLTVVGSDSGEIPHVIGDAGVVLPEDDHAEWVGALQELLESPDRRRILGEAGRARAVAEFAWPVVAGRHLDFFDELVDGATLRAGRRDVAEQCLSGDGDDGDARREWRVSA